MRIAANDIVETRIRNRAVQARITHRVGMVLLAALAAAVADSPLAYAQCAASFADRVNYSTGTAPQSVAIGDLNRDGRPDLASTNSGNNSVSVLLGDGNGTFGLAVAYATGARPYSVGTGDFNGDGWPDLAVTNFDGGNVSALLGTGNAAPNMFSSAVNYAAGLGPRSVAIGDFNADGRLDLVTANYNESHGSVSVLIGSGAGTFAAAVPYEVDRNPISVAIGDLTGDGRPDLAVANFGSSTVSTFSGNGNGTFATNAATYNVSQGPRSVAIGDLNGDGRPDLAVASGNANKVSVLLTLPAGGLAAPVEYSTGTSPFSVAIGDVNSDGRLDLAVAIFSGNTVSVLLGNGDGTFAAAANNAASGSPNSVAVGDLNGDGKLDLALAKEQRRNNLSKFLAVARSSGR